MNLYQINAEIENCIDTETGEILDVEALNNLALERDTKIENLACWYKNLMADAEALKAEKNAFAEREKAAKNKLSRLKDIYRQYCRGKSLPQTSVHCHLENLNQLRY